MFIGNGTGFTNTTLTAGNGIAVTNASGAITVSAASLGTLTGTNDYMVSLDHSDTTGKTFKKSTAFFALGTGDFEIPLDKAFWCGYIDAAIQVKTPAYYSGADKVVGARGAAVPDVTSTTNISGSDMVNETTVLASIQALETKLNLLLSRLRSTGGGHGLIT